MTEFEGVSAKLREASLLRCPARCKRLLRSKHGATLVALRECANVPKIFYIVAPYWQRTRTASCEIWRCNTRPVRTPKRSSPRSFGLDRTRYCERLQITTRGISHSRIRGVDSPGKFQLLRRWSPTASIALEARSPNALIGRNPSDGATLATEPLASRAGEGG